MRLSTIGATLACLLAPLASARAQEVAVGVAYHAADYREQAELLKFRGSGPGAWLDGSWRRFGLHAEVMRLSMSGKSATDGALDDFDLTQVDVRVRGRVIRNYGLEAGVMHRSIDPERAAQEVGAIRFGAYATYDLAPGADVVVRASYLGASEFSGGGSAPFGVEVGLTASYGPGSGRFRAIGAFDFQRFDRRTTIDDQEMSVPIQMAAGRVGVAFVW